MGLNKLGGHEGKEGKKAYSLNVRAKEQYTTGCAFCWFVLSLYPTLNGMKENDSVTFKAHLEKVHGLRQEITA
jgi:hypothetical protein